MLSELYFAKQFFIVSKPKLVDNSINNSVFDDFSNTPLINNSILYTHPKLITSIAQQNNKQLVLLGMVIDPYNPLDSDQLIIDAILLKTNNFLDIEEYLYNLGGRWVMIITQNNTTRIYHDATGLKPVFYRCLSDGQYIVASQPSLIEKLGFTKKNQSLFEIFHLYPNSSSWPIGTIPFEKVKQLLPNHFLQLDDMTNNRYWPKRSRQLLDTHSVAIQISELLKGSINALIHRNQCTLPLTAGYDSRMLLSCSLDHLDKMTFFTSEPSPPPPPLNCKIRFPYCNKNSH